MKLYKMSERTIKATPMLAAYRASGFKTTDMGRWCKWKELDYGRIQVKFDVYRVVNDMITVYLMCDSLDRVAAPMTESKEEVLGWLKEHGYKPEKQWYIEDYGMDEETWEEWNK